MNLNQWRKSRLIMGRLKIWDNILSRVAVTNFLHYKAAPLKNIHRITKVKALSKINYYFKPSWAFWNGNPLNITAWIKRI